MKDSGPIFLELITEKAEKLEKILNRATSAASPAVALQQYKEWKTKTETLILEYVGRKEANNFSQMGFVHESSTTELAKFQSDYHNLRAYLFGLASRIMNKDIEMNGAERMKERLEVLHKVYKMAGPRKMDWVIIDNLVKELGMEFTDVNDILIYWEQKGLLEGREYDVKLTPAGRDEIEEAKQGKSTDNLPANITNIFYAPVGGVQQHTQNSTQYINQTITTTGDAAFDNAISKLLELLQSSSLSDDDKEEFQNEIKSINKLALKGDPNTIERAKLKLDYIKTGLSVTDIAFKAAPHLPALYHFFENLLR